MVDMFNLFAQWREASPEFLSDYCIIDGYLWSLEQIERMSLEEYAERTIYSYPVKLYKYFPDVEKDGKNYSIIALESNEVYLSSPCDFDDVFDSEISIPEETFWEHRIKTYAKWCKCSINPGMSREDIAQALLMHIYNTVQDGGTIENAFDIEDQEEIIKLQVKLFAQHMLLEMMKASDWSIALRNVMGIEYNEFQQDLQQKFRVACFTTAPMSQLMWGGSYANEHRGFCLEYNVIMSPEYMDIIHNTRPVIYSKKRHPVTQALLDAYDRNWDIPAIRDLYLNGALRKSIDWAYQNEWRLILPPQEHGQRGFTQKFFPISKVYLGNRMSPERREKIIDICKRKGIPYIGVTRSADQFEMQECNILCENCPTFINQKKQTRPKTKEKMKIKIEATLEVSYGVDGK